MARNVQCVYLKREAPGLDYSPYPGDLGKRIYAPSARKRGRPGSSTRRCWSTRTGSILADQRARQYLARQMENFFFGTGAEQVAGISRHHPESL